MLTVLAVLLSVVPLPAAAEPPAEPVSIEVITANGTGCAPGTATVSVLPDNTGFRVDYTAFRAAAGSGAATVDFRKNCSLLLVIDGPDDFRYAYAGADFWGSAHLEPGVTGTHRSLHYFAGGPQPAYTTQSFAGPFDGAWQVSQVVPPEQLVFTPCGAVRGDTFNTELRVTAGTSADPPSWFSMQASDAEIHALYRLAWQRC